MQLHIKYSWGTKKCNGLIGRSFALHILLWTWHNPYLIHITMSQILVCYLVNSHTQKNSVLTGRTKEVDLTTYMESNIYPGPLPWTHIIFCIMTYESCKYIFRKYEKLACHFIDRRNLERVQDVEQHMTQRQQVWTWCTEQRSWGCSPKQRKTRLN